MFCISMRNCVYWIEVLFKNKANIFFWGEMLVVLLQNPPHLLIDFRIFIYWFIYWLTFAYIYISIIMTWKSGKHLHATYEALNSCFELIESHQQYKPWTSPLEGCPRGVMVKAMNCGIVVREFVLQSRYYVHFRANTLGKGMNPLILPPAMGK